MNCRWRASWAMALGLQGVGCGDVSSDVVSRSDVPPVVASGGSQNDGTPEDGTGGGGTPPAASDTDRVPCTLCSIYQYCQDDDLVEQLNNDTDCDPVVKHCEFGCLTASWGAKCALKCGETVCPLPPADTAPNAFCCTTDGRCGVSGLYTNDAPCVVAEPSAPLDAGCPKWNSHWGCCRSDGTCGIADPAPGAGCVASAELGLETTHCGGAPADAGS